MTPAAEAVQNVIDALLKRGFVANGQTRQETVRIPTMRSPATCGGKAGGELATFGGRMRFAHPSGLKATVGKRTTFFYYANTIFGNEPSGSAFDTKAFANIAQYLDEVLKVACEHPQP